MNVRPAWRAVLSLPTLIMLFILVTSSGDDEAFPLLIGVLLLMLPFVCYRRYAHLYSVQKERIEHCKGIIARNVSSIRVKDIRTINIKQGIAGRLLGIGTLEFSSAGGAGIEVTWWGLLNPDEIKNKIEHMHDSVQDSP